MARYTGAMAVTPAVLAHSRKEFEDTLAFLVAIPGISRVQIDAVDGVYAAPVSWPYVELGALRIMREEREFLPHLDRLEYEVDLMCDHAEPAISEWLRLGVSRLTLHAGAFQDPVSTLTRLRREYGGSRVAGQSTVTAFGMAFGPDADDALLGQAAPHADYIQFMGIDRIGKQGEPFDARVIDRVRAFTRVHPSVPVQVDGGVTIEHAKRLAAAGASTFVVGSAILHAVNPVAAFAAFEAALEVDFSQGGINRI